MEVIDISNIPTNDSPYCRDYPANRSRNTVGPVRIGSTFARPFHRWVMWSAIPARTIRLLMGICGCRAQRGENISWNSRKRRGDRVLVFPTWVFPPCGRQSPVRTIRLLSECGCSVASEERISPEIRGSGGCPDSPSSRLEDGGLAASNVHAGQRLE